jgi:ribonuclease HII
MSQAPLFDEAIVGLIAGVDEAGRGPLAGGVYAAAVILDAARPVSGLKDSKVLTAARREVLAHHIKTNALAWAVASASVEEIDAINILQATLLAMRRAVERLCLVPAHVLVDGNQRPRLSMPVQAIIKGDATVPAISAASILAKCARDEEAAVLAARYPGYGFERHKGYGTAEHMLQLRERGATVAHRRSFKPVADTLARWSGLEQH